jgi:hypothetical protein
MRHRQDQLVCKQDQLVCNAIDKYGIKQERQSK